MAIVSYMFAILFLKFVFASDHNCDSGTIDEIFGICGSSDCELSCDTYCDDTNNECCCNEIIQSSLDCDANNPPCLISQTSDQSIIFGFELHSQSILSTQTTTPITMTLFWNNSRYQCTIDEPTISPSYYSCGTSNLMITHKCTTLITQNEIQYGLQIEADIDTNDYATILYIDRVIIKNIDKHILSNLYLIEYFNDDVNDTFVIYKDDPSMLITINQLDESESFILDAHGDVQSQLSHPQCSEGMYYLESIHIF